MSKSHKDSWQNRANNKGIRQDRKTKNHLWHLCTLLLSIINTKKTPRVTVGKVSQARKSYCLQTQLSWWLSGSLPIRNLLQERGAKCPQGQRTMELLTHLPNLHEGGPYSPSLSGQPLINLSFALGQTFHDEWLIHQVICLKRLNGFLCPGDPGKDQPWCLSTPCTLYSGHSILQTSEEMWGPFTVF